MKPPDVARLLVLTALREREWLTTNAVGADLATYLTVEFVTPWVRPNGSVRLVSAILGLPAYGIYSVDARQAFLELPTSQTEIEASLREVVAVMQEQEASRRPALRKGEPVAEAVTEPAPVG